MQDQKSATINRPEAQDIDILKPDDDIIALKQENANLTYALSKYNEILLGYQQKYGSDLFKEIEEKLSNPLNLSGVNEEQMKAEDVIRTKKYLLENIAVFKEYEKMNGEQEQKIEFLTNEVNNLNRQFQKIAAENEELIKEKDKLEKEKTELYNTILNRKNLYNAENITDQRNYGSIDEIDNVNLKENIEDKDNKYNKDNIENNYNSSNNFNKTDALQGNLTQLKNERDQLLSALEEIRSKTVYNNNIYSEMRENYDQMSGQMAEADEAIRKLRGENEQYKTHIINLQLKLKEQQIELDKRDKERNKDLSEVDRLTIEEEL